MTLANNYAYGQQVILHNEYYKEVVGVDTLFDFDECHVYIEAPDGLETHFYYPGGGLTKVSTGIYEYAFTPDQSGIWWYVFTGEESSVVVTATPDKKFSVYATRLVR